MKFKEIPFIKHKDFSLILFLLGFLVAFICPYFKVDYKVYDLLMKVRSSRISSDTNLLVDIDDKSIYELGNYPWTRDLYADAVLTLKESGASSIIFTETFSSPSYAGFKENTIASIDNNFYFQKQEILNSVTQLTQAIQKGFIKNKDINRRSQQFIKNIIEPSVDNLNSTLIYSAIADYDDAFSKANIFSNNVFAPYEIRPMAFIQNEDNTSYASSRFLLPSIKDDHNFIFKSSFRNAMNLYGEPYTFIAPTSHVARSLKGSGFTNIYKDFDSSVRRHEVAFMVRDSYGLSLPLSYLVDNKDVMSISRSFKYLTLKGAGDDLLTEDAGGEVLVRHDIKIPVDMNGMMALDMENISSTDHISFYDVVLLNTLERRILQNLKDINALLFRNKNGMPLTYAVFAEKLTTSYDELKSMKDNLLEECKGYNDDKSLERFEEASYKEYLEAKDKFFLDLYEYVSYDFLPSVEKRFSEINNMPDDVIIDFMSSLQHQFELLKNNTESYKELKATLDGKVSGKVCIITEKYTGSNLYKTSYSPRTSLGEITASIINTVRNKDFIYPVMYLSSYIIACLLIMVVRFFLYEYSYKIRFIVHSSVLLVLVVLPVILIRNNIFVPCSLYILFGFIVLVQDLCKYYIHSLKK